MTRWCRTSNNHGRGSSAWGSRWGRGSRSGGRRRRSIVVGLHDGHSSGSAGILGIESSARLLSEKHSEEDITGNVVLSLLLLQWVPLLNGSLVSCY
jgi:hypothetical protein